MELYHKAYENVRMATWAIDAVMPEIKDKELEELLAKQNKIYLDFVEKIESMAEKAEIKLADISILEKSMSWIGIKKNLLFDKSNENVAQKLILGTTMGITQMITDMKNYGKDDEKILEVSKKILKKEEAFVESLKEFL